MLLCRVLKPHPYVRHARWLCYSQNEGRSHAEIESFLYCTAFVRLILVVVGLLSARAHQALESAKPCLRSRSRIYFTSCCSLFPPIQQELSQILAQHSKSTKISPPAQETGPSLPSTPFFVPSQSQRSAPIRLPHNPPLALPRDPLRISPPSPRSRPCPTINRASRLRAARARQWMAIH